MTNKKNTKRALLSSVLALVLCASMFVGTTFAWFTDSVTSGANKIISGNLDVDLELLDANGNWNSISESNAPVFNYEKWEPGYTDVKILKIVNNGSLALKWKAQFVSSEELSELADVIDVYVCPSDSVLTYPESREDLAPNYIRVGTVAEFVNTIEETTYGFLAAEKSAYLGIALKMQESAGNDYMLKQLGAFDIRIVATQATAEVDGFNDQYDADAEYPTFIDTWDGEATVDWFIDTITANPDATEFTLNTAEDLAGLVALVDGSLASTYSVEQLAEARDFDGATIKLNSDIDLLMIDETTGELIPFDPIGSYRQELAFRGTFDGQGHTIKNLSQNTWELDTGYYYGDLGLGLFACVEDATIKNLTIDGADISGESALCGTIAATAYGDCVFENITIKNANVADYQYYAGGIVGWASGNHVYRNCVIDETVVIGGQWGDFDNSNGGLIGGAGGSAQIKVENCTIACRIDGYNDVTSSYQWYAYRRCGMIIGNTGKTTTNANGTTVAAAPQLTCENVTVIYGEWANYTYCEFAGKSWPYVRVQAGISNSAYSNPRYGHPTDANGNTVVDDNHVHNEGEDHFILCTFDQLYGGGQGVYGTPTHEGVTVVYNNK